jgi:hypothetical protein
VTSQSPIGGWDRARVLDAFDRWRTEQPEHAQLLDAEGRAYVDYHATRYARLLDAVGELSARAGPPNPWRVLDVGPNIQTALVRTVHPEARVDTLGFEHPAVPPRRQEQHIQFDLNQSPAPPTVDRRYDVIILAEVLEHLYVPPHTVLGVLRDMLRPPGFILIQTPNAAALHKRLALLRGRNPVEPPRACRENPGHLHEYTLDELTDQVKAGGLTVQWLRAENYFGSGTGAGLYRMAGRLMPATWRHGVTLCARAGQ